MSAPGEDGGRRGVQVAVGRRDAGGGSTPAGRLGAARSRVGRVLVASVPLPRRTDPRHADRGSNGGSKKKRLAGGGHFQQQLDLATTALRRRRRPAPLLDQARQDGPQACQTGNGDVCQARAHSPRPADPQLDRRRRRRPRQGSRQAGCRRSEAQAQPARRRQRGGPQE